jgi:presenilin-like A22 family membrane protease
MLEEILQCKEYVNWIIAYVGFLLLAVVSGMGWALSTPIEIFVAVNLAFLFITFGIQSYCWKLSNKIFASCKIND